MHTLDKRKGFVDLLEKAEEPPTIEELRMACRERVVRIFSEALPGIAENIVNLAHNSERDEVRLKASTRILDEFTNTHAHQFQPGTSVQIINAIPFGRSAFDGNRELEQVDIGNVRIATSKYKRVTPTGDDTKSLRTQYGAGKRQPAAEIDAISMAKIGQPVENDPVAVQVPVLLPGSK